MKGGTAGRTPCSRGKFSVYQSIWLLSRAVPDRFVLAFAVKVKNG